MLKEFAQSFQRLVHERITSPLSGAIILSWLYWNWRIPVMLLLSNQPVEARIKLIADEYTSVYPNLIYPLATATLLLALYPWIAYLPYRWWLMADLIKEKARVAFSQGIPWSAEQANELKRELAAALAGGPGRAR
jgi:hypothetical protein